MVQFFIGDFLTGRRIQRVPALSGSWSEVLNGAGAVSCTVTLRDPEVAALDLPNTATEGKAYLAAVEGDLVLQAGPIWAHEYDDDSMHLTLQAAGAWSYFDHRELLPVTDDPASVETNVVSSLQGIARAWVEQSMTWPNGDVPIILPDEIPGTNERNEPGANLAWIGTRLAQLTEVEGGPDIQFQPRFQSDRLGIEWVMRIGTPDDPFLHSEQEVSFDVSAPQSSVSGLKVKTSGLGIASRAYAAGGRSADTVLIAHSDNAGLLEQGFPALTVVDASFSTVTEQATMQAHADGLAQLAARRLVGMSFDHDLTQRPFIEAFNVGDFARVKFRNHPYMGSQVVRMRVTGRSGDAVGKRVRVDLQPEVD